MSSYFHPTKKIADTMATIGNPLGDEENRLLHPGRDDHDNFTTSMTVIAVNEDFILSDLYGHMTAYEARTGGRTPGGYNDASFQHSANNASHGGGRGGLQRGGGGRGRGDGGRDNGGGRHHCGYNYNGGSHGGGRGDDPGRGGNAHDGGHGHGGKSTCHKCGIYSHNTLRYYSR